MDRTSISVRTNKLQAKGVLDEDGLQVGGGEGDSSLGAVLSGEGVSGSSRAGDDDGLVVWTGPDSLLIQRHDTEDDPERYFVCDDCAHCWSAPAPPDSCEHCRRSYVREHPTMEAAEEASEAILTRGDDLPCYCGKSTCDRCGMG